MATATKQPGQTDSDEQYDAAQNLWNQETDFSSQINDKYRHAGDDSARGSSDVADDTGVGGFLKNFNADEPDVKNGEENPSPVPGSRAGKGDKRSFTARLLAGSKGYLPTGGIIGIILGFFGISGGVLAPMSLLVNFSDIVSNHAGLGDHLFAKTSNSYVASFLKGNGRNCATSKIKCKFTTISEKKLKEWEDRGIKVEAEKTKIPGLTGDRYKVRGLEYNGKKVTSLNEYKNLRFTDAEFNSLLKRFPIRAYLLDKSPFRKGTLEKFKLSLADKFSSSKEKEKDKRVEENDKAMNEKTGAKVGADGKTTIAGIEEKNKAYDSKTEPVKSKLTSFKTSLKVAGGAAAATTLACMSYDVVRATEAATILMWHTDLIKFALPFLQAGAQAKESGVNGGFDWQTAEYAGDRLMQPITQKDIDADPNDDITQDMLGKTAMDSKGMDAALSGGFASLKGDQNYASKYTGWMPAGKIWGAGIVDNIRNELGADNIHTACSTAKVAMAASAATCIAKLVACASQIALQQIVSRLWGDDVLKAITERLQKPALEAIAKANLSSSLHGPLLGQALVAGAGVMTSYMDDASGFAYSGDKTQAAQAYNNMYTDEDYIKGQVAEAQKNQLDTSNAYSFAGQLSSAFSSVGWDGTAFSAFANLFGATAKSPVLFANASAMQQGIYQPIGIYQTQQQLDGTLTNCESPGLTELSIPCLGESGRAVPQLMPNVQDCLDEEQQGDGSTLCLEKAVDYLSSHTYKNGNDDKPIIDKDSGQPSDWSGNVDGTQDYKNPFLMFMAYCGRDRVYPLGYTDKSVEDDTDNWHTGENCAASSSTKTTEVCQDRNCAGPSSKSDRDVALGWMSYYYNMCIGLYASEENQDYCWQDEAAPSTGNSNVCSLLNNPHIHYEQKTTEEDLKKLCAGESVKSYCGNDIKINPELINTLVANSNKYDITINNFGFYDDRHVSNDCQPGKQHWKGNAVDLSKVSLVDGSSAVGSGGGGAGNGVYGGISYNSQTGPILSQYASDFLAGISPNRGGVGQKGCTSSFNPNFPAGSTNVNGAAFFEDSCDHLHIDVRDRTNLNGI